MDNDVNRISDFHSKSYDLLNDIVAKDNKKDRKQVIRRYLEHFDVDCGLSVPNFENDWQWFNVKNPLSIDTNLQGKVLVLDFFTYCCINCIHILPDLEALEHAFKDTDGVVIIGVHSAKFDNEKVPENILSAVLRYNITHPVVNDTEAKLWHALQIRCWPTLAVVSPAGHLLFLMSGEGHGQTLMDFVSEAVDYYGSRREICHAPVSIKLAKDGFQQSTLYFPGKICVNDDASMLAIADTGHNRIVITDGNGIIQHCVGGDEPGFRDGCFNYTQMHSPQGVCFRGKSEVYVADTENHAVRKIDLVKQAVTTVAGSGRQGQDYKGGKIATEQEISSPWDIVLAPDNPDVLYIAMAGTHQIWVLYLKDFMGAKGSHTGGTCMVFAGSGSEENRNNNYPHKAGFAQPSGLAVGKVLEESEQYTLYVADSESSTIRAVSLKDGSVKGLVGGDIDPTNLFAFGDVDGKGTNAKLQHPLGVGVIPGSLLVADSYNHKIKLVNPLTRGCTSILGSGSPGSITGLSSNDKGSVLNEPGGMAVHPSGNTLYIADTNNHCIKILTIASRELSELPVIHSTIKRKSNTQAIPKKPAKLSAKTSTRVNLEALKVTPGKELKVHMRISVPEGLELNREAPNRWSLHSDNECFESTLDGKSHGTMTCVANMPLCKVTVPASLGPYSTSLETHTSIYLCSEDGTCTVKNLIFIQPLAVAVAGSGADEEDGGQDTDTIFLKYKL